MLKIDFLPEGGGLCPPSRAGVVISVGDGAGGALVDAGSAVDALSGVDDGDVVAGDGTLGAHIDTGSTRNALGLIDYCYHFYGLRGKTDEGV